MKNPKVVAIASGVTAVVLLVVGLVLMNQANFSHNYVGTQLKQHGITFTPVAGLLPAQKKVPCLVADAGKQLTTGKQAECYALNQIGIDLTTIDHGRGYFQDHYAAYLSQLKTQAAEAKAPNAPATLALVQSNAVLNEKANELFYGETMKGLLLSAYGFSILGDRAEQAAYAVLAAAGIFFAVMIGALVVGARKRRTVRVLSDTLTTSVSSSVDNRDPVAGRQLAGQGTQRS